jgi:SPX domain protein involved in polyphosphate accumulation
MEKCGIMEDVTKYRLGSKEWQDAMLKNVMEKFEKGEEIDSFEKAFLEVQAEHIKRKIKKVV